MEVSIATSICLVILGAWFVLRIGVAELILTLFVLTAAAAAAYWLWTGNLVSETLEGLGIFALLVIILGAMRVGIEKLSHLLGILLRPPSHAEAASDRQGKSCGRWRLPSP